MFTRWNIFRFDTQTNTYPLYISEIAFVAYADNINRFYHDGTTIIFNKVLLNDKQGYNPYTGIFKAPVSGVYRFTAHVCNQPGKHMVYAILKRTGHKQTQIAISTVYEEKASSCSSVSTLAKIAENDYVNVVARWEGSYLFANEYRWISFSGILMYSNWMLTPDGK